jgi:hypothetical protein
LSERNNSPICRTSRFKNSFVGPFQTIIATTSVSRSSHIRIKRWVAMSRSFRTILKLSPEIHGRVDEEKAGLMEEMVESKGYNVHIFLALRAPLGPARHGRNSRSALT